MLLGLTAVALVAAAAAPARAQTIRGLLLDGATDDPVDLGRVAMIDPTGDTVATALSDEQGLFSVTAREGGRYRLVLRAFGYRAQGAGPYDVDDGGLMVVQVVLEAEPVALEGIDVETDRPLFEEGEPWLTRQGFYVRRKIEQGHFLGPEDIAREAALVTYTPELFTRIPGVSVSGGRVRMRGTTGGECSPVVFVDGARMSGTAMRGLGLDGVAPLAVIDAAEVYTRPLRVPPEYRWVAGGCGVIVLWTKH